MSTPRPGARGPIPDLALDDRLHAIGALLKSWGFSGGYAQIAASISIERGQPISADAVRKRMQRPPRTT